MASRTNQTAFPNVWKWWWLRERERDWLGLALLCFAFCSVASQRLVVGERPTILGSSDHSKERERGQMELGVRRRECLHLGKWMMMMMVRENDNDNNNNKGWVKFKLTLGQACNSESVTESILNQRWAGYALKPISIWFVTFKGACLGFRVFRVQSEIDTLNPKSRGYDHNFRAGSSFL